MAEDDALELRWAALLASLPLGPEALASHPSAEPQLREDWRLPGMGLRSSDAVARTAVSLAFLRAFYEQLVLPLCVGGAQPTTKEVVERVVKPLSAGRSCLADRLPPAAVGIPTAFVSHAWGTCHAGDSPVCACSPGAGSFALTVASVSDFFANAVPSETFLWVDVFAVDQHDAQVSDLDGGLTLEKTVALSAHTLVVLDKSALPLSRLWCLYEIGSTPPEKLQLLTRGFAAAQVTANFLSLDVAEATCWDREDGYYEEFIRSQIERVHGSEALFEQKLKLRLLLKPMSYEADLQALLSNSASDTWTFDSLYSYIAGDGDGHRLACISAGAGEGKSTIAAALCSKPGLVHAYHFCKSSDVGRQDIGAVMRSLAYQLATARDGEALRFPLFAKKLLSLEASELEVLGNHDYAFLLLLGWPLATLQAGQRVVLLIDALDEAETPDNPVNVVLDLLLRLGRLQWLHLSVIVTTRPGVVIDNALQARWKEGLRQFPPGQLRAVSVQPKLLQLLNTRLAGDAAASADQAYARFFDAAPPSAEVRCLIDILLAARQPPSLALLDELGMRNMRTKLPGWGLLFFERDYCVHLLHKSFADWLRDTSRSGDHAADVMRGHVTWANMLARQLAGWLDGGGKAPVNGSYLYRHALAHFDTSGRATESKQLLMRLPWLQATLRERGVWALIRDVAARSVLDDGVLDILRRTLILSAPGLCGVDADIQLLTQLVGRLGWLDGASFEVTKLVAEARAFRGATWLSPTAPMLRQPMGTLEVVLQGHTSHVSSLAETFDGHIVSGSGDSKVRIWNPATGECERVLSEHTRTVTSVTVAPDGRIVSGSEDDTVCIWNAATGECECVLKGHKSGVSSVTVAADGRVVSGSQDNSVRIWNVASGRCERVLIGHTEAVNCLAITFGGSVVSGSDDKTVRTWNATTGECKLVLNGHTHKVKSLVISSDGRIVSGSWDRTVRLWSAVSGECECILQCTAAVYAVAAMSDGRILCGAGDKTVRIWNASTGDCDRVLEGHTADVTAVAVIAGGRIVSGACDMTVRIWNVAAKGDAVRLREKHTDWISTLAATADGKIVSGSSDNTVRIWNPVTGQCERVLEGHTSLVTSVAVINDERIVSFAMDGTVRFWNAATGKCDRVLDAGREPATGVVGVTADGLIVSGYTQSPYFTAECNHFRIWNAAVNAWELVPEALTAEVEDIVESINCGRRVLSWSFRVAGCEVPYTDSADRAIKRHCMSRRALRDLEYHAISCAEELYCFVVVPGLEAGRQQDAA